MALQDLDPVLGELFRALNEQFFPLF
jgi:hypothetical protein